MNKEILRSRELEPQKEQQIFWEELGHAPEPQPAVEEQLAAIRQQLETLQPPHETPLASSTVVETSPPKSDSPEGTIREKNLKRKKQEAKERKPKNYREKMIVLSDTQLLSETNEEGVGALMAYLKDQGDTFTHVVLNGDIIDFRQQSGFKDDNQMGDSVTIDEQVAGRWFIDEVERLTPNARERVFMMGNHEARYENMYRDTNNGVAQYLKPFEEVFGLDKWEVHEYGKGNSYDWHGRKIRHGHKGGAKTNIPKIEMEEAMGEVTVGHIITNRMWEQVDSNGDSHRSYVHAGFSKPAHYDKSGDKRPSNGFGVYYYDKIKGKEVMNEYMIVMPANHSRFISPEGELYDGVGYKLRQEAGLDPKTRGKRK